MLAYLDDRGFIVRRAKFSERLKLLPEWTDEQWWHKVLFALWFVPLALLSRTFNAAGKVIGRGWREYSLEATPLPAPPPGAGVREPRNPSPSLDSGQLDPGLA